MQRGFKYRLERIEGVPVAFMQMPSRRKALTQFTYGTGSHYEIEEKDSGISHALEHAVFRGGKKYPSGPKLSKVIEDIGGIVNAGTGNEFTSFYVATTPSKVPVAIDVLTDMLNRPKLKTREAGLRIERGAIQAEVKMYEDDPAERADALFERALWGDNSLGRPICGTVDTVSKFTGARYESRMKRCYVPSNMVVTVAGTFDLDTAREALRQGLLDLPSGEHLVAPEPPQEYPAALLIHETKEVQQANVVMGTRGVAAGDPDRPALVVLQKMLNGASGPLFVEIREKRGLVYGVYASAQSFANTGVFEIGLGCAPEDAPEAMRLARRELERISTRVKSELLADAKSGLAGGTEMSLDSLDSVTSRVSTGFLRNGKITSPMDAVSEIQAVTAADVQRVARKLLDQPWRAGATSPLTDASRIEKALTA